MKPNQMQWDGTESGFDVILGWMNTNQQVIALCLGSHITVATPYGGRRLYPGHHLHYFPINDRYYPGWA